MLIQPRILKSLLRELSIVGPTEPQGAASFGAGVKDAFPCIPSFAVGCTEPQGAATQAIVCASFGVGVTDAFPCMCQFFPCDERHQQLPKNRAPNPGKGTKFPDLTGPFWRPRPRGNLQHVCLRSFPIELHYMHNHPDRSLASLSG